MKLTSSSEMFLKVMEVGDVHTMLLLTTGMDWMDEVPRNEK